MVANGIPDNLGVPFEDDLSKAQLLGKDCANFNSFGFSL